LFVVLTSRVWRYLINLFDYHPPIIIGLVAYAFEINIIITVIIIEVTMSNGLRKKIKLKLFTIVTQFSLVTDSHSARRNETMTTIFVLHNYYYTE